MTIKRTFTVRVQYGRFGKAESVYCPCSSENLQEVMNAALGYVLDLKENCPEVNYIQIDAPEVYEEVHNKRKFRSRIGTFGVDGIKFTTIDQF